MPTGVCRHLEGTRNFMRLVFQRKVRSRNLRAAVNDGQPYLLEF